MQDQIIFNPLFVIINVDFRNSLDLTVTENYDFVMITSSKGTVTNDRKLIPKINTEGLRDFSCLENA